MSIRDTHKQKDNVFNTDKTLSTKGDTDVFYKRLERIEERSQRLAAAFLVLGDTIKDISPVSVYQGLCRASELLVGEATLVSSGGSMGDLRHAAQELEKAVRQGRGALRTGYWSGYISEMNFEVVHGAVRRLLEELQELFRLIDLRRPGSHIRLFSSHALPPLENDSWSPTATSESTPKASQKTPYPQEKTPDRVGGELVPSAPEKQPAGSVTAEQRQVKQNRQVRIIGLLSRLGTVSLTDITGEFPGVSAKTIQRDLKNLIASEKVIREGERRWSTYRLA